MTQSFVLDLTLVMLLASFIEFLVLNDLISLSWLVKQVLLFQETLLGQFSKLAHKVFDGHDSRDESSEYFNVTFLLQVTFGADLGLLFVCQVLLQQDLVSFFSLRVQLQMKSWEVICMLKEYLGDFRIILVD